MIKTENKDVWMCLTSLILDVEVESRPVFSSRSSG
jgi:hypothetical protein